MTKQKIIGVDFSGAGRDNEVGNTWVTTGNFDGTRKLTIDVCRPVSRKKLEQLLTGLPSSAVAALDFPFGVPESFAAKEYQFKGTLMHEMWEIVSEKVHHDPKYVQKMRCRLRTGGDLNELNKTLRKWDKRHFSETAYSPLNPANPEMFPMTFCGMKMLHALWKETNCRIPPLDNAVRTGPVLLETMPGAALKARGLGYTPYKNNKGRNAVKNSNNRKVIIEKLPCKFGIDMPNLQDYRDLCMFSHDALDSMVAAAVAALWAMDETLFHKPEDHQDPAMRYAAKKEGCIYAPKPQSTEEMSVAAY